MEQFSLFHSLHTFVVGVEVVMEVLVKQEGVVKQGLQADGWSSSEFVHHRGIVQMMVVLFLSFHLVVLVLCVQLELVFVGLPWCLSDWNV